MALSTATGNYRRLYSSQEYKDHFLTYPTQVIRGKPAPQELKVGGEFFGSTENREQYHAHEIGERYKIVKPEYIPNPSKLEGLTTQKDNYKPWLNVQPPKRRQQQPYKPSEGAFDSTTTNKHDFGEKELPVHYYKPPQPYITSNAKMDTVSTQVADYRPWEVTSVPSRRKAAAVPSMGDEDRYHIKFNL
ncbi:hypothetical protein HDV02_005767 [Globomyces sp. JEL0801]|nr:hypothetical protein HDV02_005767 [Globomyces sp. JEL0801]